jgi:hypothetical protein
MTLTEFTTRVNAIFERQHDKRFAYITDPKKVKPIFTPYRQDSLEYYYLAGLTPRQTCKDIREECEMERRFECACS